MEEAERLCDRIIIIDHGKVIANDTLAAVRRLVPSVNVLEIGVENPGRDGWLSGLRALEGVSAAEWDGSMLRVTMRDLLDGSPRVLVWLRERGYRMQPPDQPARRPGDGLSHLDRKERTQRMSYTAFQALVRRDLRLFFHGPPRRDHELRRADRDRVVLRLHLRRSRRIIRPRRSRSPSSIRMTAKSRARW